MTDYEVQYNLYGKPWGKLLTKESSGHPAKFSLLLTRWIFQHGLEHGYWQPGSVILDPFGGVGCGGVIAPEYGLSWLGVELEPKFVRMANGYDCPGFLATGPDHPDACAKCQREWNAWKRNSDKYPFPDMEPHHYTGNLELRPLDPAPMLVQGDSRNLRQIVDTALAGAVTSPPYAEGLGHWQSYTDPSKQAAEYSKSIYQEKRVGMGDYGFHPDNIGRFPWAGAMTSPPYANRVDDHGTDKPEYDGMVEKLGTYGRSDGQVGSLFRGAVTSPPFSQPETRDRSPVQDGVISDTITRAYTADHAAGDAANIGLLRIDGGVTSPPYEEGLGHVGVDKHPERASHNSTGNEMNRYGSYGGNAENIGNRKGETYWSACRAVYAEVFALLPPGGVFAVVVKNFLKEKKVIPLCDMTLDLLISVGFEPIKRTAAMQYSVDEKTGEMKRHAGFFRRLIEQKGGPVIDYEEVLWLRRP